MSLDPSKLVAISYPKAIELCRQLNGATISDDLLCRGGWPGPVAVSLGKLMHRGTGGTITIEELRQMGFCSSDAILVAGQIAAQGAR
jgi:hypothetical protein